MGVAPTLVHKEALLLDLADLWHGQANQSQLSRLPGKHKNVKASVDSVKKKKRRRRSCSKTAGMKERSTIMKGN